MTVLLDAVRGEIASLESRLSKLMEIEALAVELDGEPVVAAPEPPVPLLPIRERAKKPAARRTGTQRTVSAEAQEKVLAAVNEAGVAKPSAIAKATGLPRSVQNRATKALIDRGEIVAEGKTQDRVLKALHPVAQPVLAPPESKARQEPPLAGRVLAEIGYKANTISGLAGRLAVPMDDVATAVRQLEREGEIKATAQDNRVMWSKA